MVQLGRFLFGSKPRMQPRPNFTGPQQDLLSSIMGGAQPAAESGLGWLQEILGGGQDAFEAPAMRQFQEQIIPSLAERFAGVGGLSSSAFNQAMGSAGAGLAENLASHRQSLRGNALSQLMPFLTQSLQPQYSYQSMPGTKGLLGGLLESPGFGEFQKGLGMWGLQKLGLS